MLVKNFRSPYRRRQVQTRLDPWLRARGFPTFNLSIIRLPDLTLCRHSLRIFARTVDSLPLAPLEKLWAKSRVRGRLCKPKSFADNWGHVRLATSGSFHAEPCAPAFCKQPMTLVRRNFCIPVRLPPEAEVQACEEASAAAFKEIFHCRPPLVPPVPVPAALKQKWREHVKTTRDYDEYVSEFRADHAVFVPDDKNKKWAWAIRPETYQLLLCTFAMLSASWVITSLPMLQISGFVLCYIGSWAKSFFEDLGWARCYGCCHTATFPSNPSAGMVLSTFAKRRRTAVCEKSSAMHLGLNVGAGVHCIGLGIFC